MSVLVLNWVPVLKELVAGACANLGIEENGLYDRAVHAFFRSSYNGLLDIIEAREQDLRKLDGVGAKTLPIMLETKRLAEKKRDELCVLNRPKYKYGLERLRIAYLYFIDKGFAIEDIKIEVNGIPIDSMETFP